MAYANNWNLLKSSILAHAVGIAPTKDNYWSSLDHEFPTAKGNSARAGFFSYRNTLYVQKIQRP